MANIYNIPLYYILTDYSLSQGFFNNNNNIIISAKQMLGLLDAVTFQVAQIQTVNPLVQSLLLGTGHRHPNNSITKCLLC